jgi:hypothetical protein
MPEDLTALHRKAMRCMDEAQAYIRRALEAEEHCARTVTDELSRSVLFRSAASMAMLLGGYEKALELAHAGLDGLAESPPREIRGELHAVVAEANRKIARRDGDCRAVRATSTPRLDLCMGRDTGGGCDVNQWDRQPGETDRAERVVRDG